MGRVPDYWIVSQSVSQPASHPVRWIVYQFTGISHRKALSLSLGFAGKIRREEKGLQCDFQSMNMLCALEKGTLVEVTIFLSPSVYLLQIPVCNSWVQGLFE